MVLGLLLLLAIPRAVLADSDESRTARIERAGHRYMPAELAPLSGFHERGPEGALSGRPFLASSIRPAHRSWADDIDSTAQKISRGHVKVLEPREVVED